MTTRQKLRLQLPHKNTKKILKYYYKKLTKIKYSRRANTYSHCTSTSIVSSIIYHHLSAVVTVYKCLHGWAPTYLADDCLAISTIAGKRHLRSAGTGLLCTQDKDHAGDEEFRGRRSSYLEQSTWHPACCNSLPLDVCWTSEGSPVWFTEGARLRTIYDALYKSTHHHHLWHQENF